MEATETRNEMRQEEIRRETPAPTIKEKISDIEQRMKHAEGKHEELQQLERDLDSLGRSPEAVPFRRIIDENKKAVQYMDAKELSYDDATLLAMRDARLMHTPGLYGKIARWSTGKKAALTVGAAVGVGGLAIAAWEGIEYLRDNEIIGAGPEGPGAGEVQYVKGHQAIDPLLTPAVDTTTATPEELAGVIGTDPLTMDPNTFFDRVYPTLSPQLQNHIIRSDLVPKLTDGSIQNDEIGRLFLHKEQAGGMFINYEYRRIGENGGEINYLQSPISVTDAQAVQIEKAYKGAQ